MNPYADQNQPRVEILAVTYPNLRISSVWEQIEKSNLMRRMSQLHSEVKKFSNQILRISFLDRAKNQPGEPCKCNRSERKEGRERCKNGRKGMWSALQRNIMHASIWRKRALKNPSVCGKAPSAGEHCPYPAAEKSLEQMMECRAGDWESVWPKLYFRFVNLMLVLFPPLLECLLHHTGLSQEQLAEGRGKFSVMPLSWLCSCTEFGRGFGGNQDAVGG